MANAQLMTRKDLEAKLVAKAWEDEAFKQELISNPKAVIEREIGGQLPENADIQVIEETDHTVYIVLPDKPQQLSSAELEAVAGGVGEGSAPQPQTSGSTLPVSQQPTYVDQLLYKIVSTKLNSQ